MKEAFDKYVRSVSAKFSREETSEMGYRSDFETLLNNIFNEIKVKSIAHDPRAREGNRPDFIVHKGQIPILYIETKDIGVSLDKIEKSEQMARYFGYANLVLTDYVEFRFYRNGIKYGEPVRIAQYDLKNRAITPIPGSYEHLSKTLLDFARSHKEPIKSGEHLSKIMGGKAQRIRENVRHFLSIESEKNADILKLYETFKKLLVHDLTHEAFADMYAQTLVYGLFVARHNDKTPETFSRQEARDLVPDSNPLLQDFFDHIVGPRFDKRLEPIVDELCEVFSHANVTELMREYIKGEDPVIHFYEDFLKEYDPQLRKKMGAFYTPLPVVRFIVRAVDHILEKDFGLSGGLSDTSKTSSGVHRVQVLDPAAGTGTFISAVIRSIYQRLLKNGQKGRWPAYVHNDLLPRLHGFELMMAPYTIAHLKLSMAFKETGFWKFHRRLGIYLTNSLEEGIAQEALFTGFGFAESIAQESKEAMIIKTKTPIMVVIGNPPYSVSSSNKGEWISNLIKEYKKGLNERNIQPLSDDYIKFIRLAEHFIEKNGSGIVAMITNNSFLDGSIHRQMRKHLLETFDDIYILDLHGNSKKKEKAPDGNKDVNVFDIQQGVGISIFVRKESKNKGFGIVHHAELYGTREEKFKALNKSDIQSIKWKKIVYSEPNYFFIARDFESENEYKKYFGMPNLFQKWASGSATAKDDFIIRYSIDDIKELRSCFDRLSDQEISQKYQTNQKNVFQVRKDIENIIGEYSPISYRPFDIRYTLYSPNSEGVFQRPRSEIMRHLFKNNIAFQLTSKNRQLSSGYFFVSRTISDRHLLDTAGDSMSVFPLYLYSEDGSRTPNLKKEIVDEIEKTTGKVSPEDIFDYIYAVLHSPSYRTKYKEFLKIDFPRVPYPKDAKTFKALVKLGAQLRGLHLLEDPIVNKFITTYPASGPDTVEKVLYKDGKVFINKEQYFGKVPEIAWNFYIGGYQPAQKWLKDRKGRKLTNADIEHYQKIIVALTETDRIMKEIDKIAPTP